MSIKTFWIILLKIIGISLVAQGVNIVLNFVAMLSNMTYFRDVTYEFVWNIVVIFIYFFTIWLFIFQTSWLISKFKLEKGFNDEKIDLNIQLSTILKIATIVVGGLMIINSLPQLCQELFVFFQQKAIFRENPNTNWIILYLVKIIFGYLLMTNSNTIVKFINKRSSGNINPDDTSPKI